MRRLLTALGCSFAALLVAALTGLGATAAHAGVDDFSYRSWEGHYELSLDGEGRAVARVTETLIAQFPDFDQNRGIVRALPLRYEGAPAAPEKISVTDASGNAVPFETDDQDEFRLILVGDDSFVHGEQSYVISYTIHDPVIAATETAVDEFYWDVLPLERQQPIERFSLTVDLSPELAAALTGDASCYTGAAGATSPCDIAANNDTLAVEPMPVLPGSGVTVAIGFAPGTVVQPPERLPNFALDGLPPILTSIAAALGLAGTIATRRLRAKRRSHRGTIVAQYDVPAHLPPLIAGPVSESKESPLSAQLVHLAVNGVTRIEEGESGTGLFGTGKPQTEFRLLDTARMGDPLDADTVDALFMTRRAGSVAEIPKKSETFATRMQTLQARGVTEANSRGYFTKERSRAARAFGTASFVLLIPAAVLFMLSLSREPGPGMFASVMLGALAIITASIANSKHRVHTPLGAEAREYLEGVREFIRVAEADRLRMLQSYSGAERLSDGTVNVVHLYEKLLPYAMLFGYEKEWGKVLEVQYREQNISAPLWYPAMGTNTQPLSRSLADISSSFTSAASYTSSSSGGSTGGGFSGGGGGGGFSGGR